MPTLPEWWLNAPEPEPVAPSQPLPPWLQAPPVAPLPPSAGVPTPAPTPYVPPPPQQPPGLPWWFGRPSDPGMAPGYAQPWGMPSPDPWQGALRGAGELGPPGQPYLPMGLRADERGQPGPGPIDVWDVVARSYMGEPQTQAAQYMAESPVWPVIGERIRRAWEGVEGPVEEFQLPHVMDLPWTEEFRAREAAGLYEMGSERIGIPWRSDQKPRPGQDLRTILPALGAAWHDIGQAPWPDVRSAARVANALLTTGIQVLGQAPVKLIEEAGFGPFVQELPAANFLWPLPPGRHMTPELEAEAQRRVSEDGTRPWLAQQQVLMESLAGEPSLREWSIREYGDTPENERVLRQVGLIAYSSQHSKMQAVRQIHAGGSPITILDGRKIVRGSETPEDIAEYDAYVESVRLTDGEAAAREAGERVRATGFIPVGSDLINEIIGQTLFDPWRIRDLGAGARAYQRWKGMATARFGRAAPWADSFGTAYRYMSADDMARWGSAVQEGADVAQAARMARPMLTGALGQADDLMRLARATGRADDVSRLQQLGDALGDAAGRINPFEYTPRSRQEQLANVTYQLMAPMAANVEDGLEAAAMVKQLATNPGALVPVMGEIPVSMASVEARPAIQALARDIDDFASLQDGVPFSRVDFLAELEHAVMKFGEELYGVKAIEDLGWYQRFANDFRSLSGEFFLTLNPGYHFSNFYGDIGTITFDGLMTLTGRKKIDAYFDAFGPTTRRLSQLPGTSGAQITEVRGFRGALGKFTGPIRDFAMRQEEGRYTRAFYSAHTKLWQDIWSPEVPRSLVARGHLPPDLVSDLTSGLRGRVDVPGLHQVVDAMTGEGGAGVDVVRYMDRVDDLSPGFITQLESRLGRARSSDEAAAIIDEQRQLIQANAAHAYTIDATRPGRRTWGNFEALQDVQEELTLRTELGRQTGMTAAQVEEQIDYLRQALVGSREEMNRGAQELGALLGQEYDEDAARLVMYYMTEGRKGRLDARGGVDDARKAAWAAYNAGTPGSEVWPQYFAEADEIYIGASRNDAAQLGLAARGVERFRAGETLQDITGKPVQDIVGDGVSRLRSMTQELTFRRERMAAMRLEQTGMDFDRMLDMQRLAVDTARENLWRRVALNPGIDSLEIAADATMHVDEMARTTVAVVTDARQQMLGGNMTMGQYRRIQNDEWDRYWADAPQLLRLADVEINEIPLSPAAMQRALGSLGWPAEQIQGLAEPQMRAILTSAVRWDPLTKAPEIPIEQALEGTMPHVAQFAGLDVAKMSDWADADWQKFEDTARLLQNEAGMRSDRASRLEAAQTTMFEDLARQRGEADDVVDAVRAEQARLRGGQAEALRARDQRMADAHAERARAGRGEQVIEPLVAAPRPEPQPEPPLPAVVEPDALPEPVDPVYWDASPEERAELAARAQAEEAWTAGLEDKGYNAVEGRAGEPLVKIRWPATLDDAVRMVGFDPAQVVGKQWQQVAEQLARYAEEMWMDMDPDGMRLYVDSLAKRKYEMGTMFGEERMMRRGKLSARQVERMISELRGPTRDRAQLAFDFILRAAGYTAEEYGGLSFNMRARLAAELGAGQLLRKELPMSVEPVVGDVVRVNYSNFDTPEGLVGTIVDTRVGPLEDTVYIIQGQADPALGIVEGAGGTAPLFENQRAGLEMLEQASRPTQPLLRVPGITSARRTEVFEAAAQNVRDAAYNLSLGPGHGVAERWREFAEAAKNRAPTEAMVVPIDPRITQLAQEWPATRLFDEMKEVFGTTTNYQTSGWVLPDGTMIDIGGDWAQGTRNTHNAMVRRVVEGEEVALLPSELPPARRAGGPAIRPTEPPVQTLDQMTVSADTYRWLMSKDVESYDDVSPAMWQRFIDETQRNIEGLDPAEAGQMFLGGEMTTQAGVIERRLADLEGFRDQAQMRAGGIQQDMFGAPREIGEIQEVGAELDAAQTGLFGGEIEGQIDRGAFSEGAGAVQPTRRPSPVPAEGLPAPQAGADAAYEAEWPAYLALHNGALRISVSPQSLAVMFGSGTDITPEQIRTLGAALGWARRQSLKQSKLRGLPVQPPSLVWDFADLNQIVRTPAATGELGNARLEEIEQMLNSLADWQTGLRQPVPMPGESFVAAPPGLYDVDGFPMYEIPGQQGQAVRDGARTQWARGQMVPGGSGTSPLPTPGVDPQAPIFGPQPGARAVPQATPRPGGWVSEPGAMAFADIVYPANVDDLARGIVSQWGLERGAIEDWRAEDWTRLASAIDGRSEALTGMPRSWGLVGQMPENAPDALLRAAQELFPSQQDARLTSWLMPNGDPRGMVGGELADPQQSAIARLIAPGDVELSAADARELFEYQTAALRVRVQDWDDATVYPSMHGMVEVSPALWHDLDEGQVAALKRLVGDASQGSGQPPRLYFEMYDNGVKVRTGVLENATADELVDQMLEIHRELRADRAPDKPELARRWALMGEEARGRAGLAGQPGTQVYPEPSGRYSAMGRPLEGPRGLLREAGPGYHTDLPLVQRVGAEWSTEEMLRAADDWHPHAPDWPRDKGRGGWLLPDGRYINLEGSIHPQSAWDMVPLHVQRLLRQGERNADMAMVDAQHLLEAAGGVRVTLHPVEMGVSWLEGVTPSEAQRSALVRLLGERRRLWVREGKGADFQPEFALTWDIFSPDPATGEITVRTSERRMNARLADLNEMLDALGGAEAAAGPSQDLVDWFATQGLEDVASITVRDLDNAQEPLVDLEKAATAAQEWSQADEWNRLKHEVVDKLIEMVDQEPPGEGARMALAWPAFGDVGAQIVEGGQYLPPGYTVSPSIKKLLGRSTAVEVPLERWDELAQEIAGHQQFLRDNPNMLRAGGSQRGARYADGYRDFELKALAEELDQITQAIVAPVVPGAEPGAAPQLAPFEERLPVGAEVEYLPAGAFEGDPVSRGTVVGHRTEPSTGETFARIETPGGHEAWAGDINEIRLVQQEGVPMRPGAGPEAAPMVEPGPLPPLEPGARPLEVPAGPVAAPQVEPVAPPPLPGEPPIEPTTRPGAEPVPAAVPGGAPPETTALAVVPQPLSRDQELMLQYLTAQLKLDPETMQQGDWIRVGSEALERAMSLRRRADKASRDSWLQLGAWAHRQGGLDPVGFEQAGEFLDQPPPGTLRPRADAIRAAIDMVPEAERLPRAGATLSFEAFSAWKAQQYGDLADMAAVQRTLLSNGTLFGADVAVPAQTTRVLVRKEGAGYVLEMIRDPSGQRMAGGFTVEELTAFQKVWETRGIAPPPVAVLEAGVRIPLAPWTGGEWMGQVEDAQHRMIDASRIESLLDAEGTIVWARAPEDQAVARREVQRMVIKSYWFEDYRTARQAKKRADEIIEAGLQGHASATSARPANWQGSDVLSTDARTASQGGYMGRPSLADITRVLEQQELGALDQIGAGVTGDWGKIPPGGRITNEQARMFHDWIERDLRGTMTTAKGVVSDGARRMADFALLDYKSYRRRGDEWLGLAVPWGFWRTRNWRNWLLRFAERPGAANAFLRYREYREDQNRERDMRERFEGKIGIPAAGVLPDWAGDKLYVDPVSYFLPPMQLMPSQWAEPIDEAANPFDALLRMANTFGMRPYGFLEMPLRWANVVGQREDQGYFLPQTGLLQAGSAVAREMSEGAAAQIPPGGWSIEGGVRRGLGLPEQIPWDPYRVGRMVSNMAADDPSVWEAGLVAGELQRRIAQKELSLQEAMGWQPGGRGSPVISPNLQRLAQEMGWDEGLLWQAQTLLQTAVQRSALERAAPTLTRNVMGVPATIYPRGEQTQYDLQREAGAQEYSALGGGMGSREQLQQWQREHPEATVRSAARSLYEGQEGYTGWTPEQLRRLTRGREERVKVDQDIDAQLDGLLHARPWDRDAARAIEEQRWGAHDAINQQFAIERGGPGYATWSTYGASPQEKHQIRRDEVLSAVARAIPDLDAFKTAEGEPDWDRWRGAVGTFFDHLPDRMLGNEALETLASEMYVDPEVLLRGVTEEQLTAYRRRNDSAMEAVVQVWEDEFYSQAWDRYHRAVERGVEKSTAWEAHMEKPSIAAEELIARVQKAYPQRWTDAELRQTYEGVEFPGPAQVAHMRKEPEQRAIIEAQEAFWTFFNEDLPPGKLTSEARAIPLIELVLDAETRGTATGEQYELALEKLALWKAQNQDREEWGAPVEWAQARAENEKFREVAAEMYPNALQLQERYYELDQERRDEFRDSNPELVEYWDFRRFWGEQYPVWNRFYLGETGAASAGGGLPAGRAGGAITGLWGAAEFRAELHTEEYIGQARQENTIFRDLVITIFGEGIYTLQDAYFEVPNSMRDAFLAEFPQLQAYWDYRRTFADEYPIWGYWYVGAGKYVRDQWFGASGDWGGGGGGGYFYTPRAGQWWLRPPDPKGRRLEPLPYKLKGAPRLMDMPGYRNVRPPNSYWLP